MRNLATSETTIEAVDDDPIALTDIYDATKNIAVWDRQLSKELIEFANAFCAENSNFQLRICGNLKTIQQYLMNHMPASTNSVIFVEDVLTLVDMYCELLDTDSVGLRLAVLTKAMCPKFHVDRVTARLITTYSGVGTEWVENQFIQRSGIACVKVNPGSPIRQLDVGQVALLKGEAWEGNEGKGLVHRSPAANSESPRLVLTLDSV